MNYAAEADHYSRIRATAASLSCAALQHQFIDQRVLLTGERDFLATENGRRCFADSLRLLIRMVKNLTVDVAAASPEFAHEMEAFAARQSWDKVPTITKSPITDFAGFEAILSAGSTGRADLPWTVVNSTGWAVRVSSKGKDLPRSYGQPNAIGALAAACLGATEVFKRLIQLRPEAGTLQDLLCFSFYSYKAVDDPGPELVGPINLNFLLVGAGAIGNGIIHLLNGLPIGGRVDVVDKQVYGKENWGTCILVEPRHVGHPKAVAAQSWLKPKLRAEAFHETIQVFKDRCGKEVGWPRLIVGALDDSGARRCVQDLWPDQIIDGAIGPTSCEVTVHPWGPDLSCLKCDFPEPTEDSAKVQQEATGLRPERLGDSESLVTEEDVQIAPLDRQEWLRSQVGKKVCSAISEGVLALYAGRAQQEGFEPSVPFVACLSACMVVAELVRYVQGMPGPLQTGFQFSVLFGPQNGLLIDHSRKRDCFCVARRGAIEVSRKRRGLG